MKKLFLVLGLVLSVWKLVHAQPVNIPGSQFPQVSVPSNSMRFFMVYPPGGLSANPLLASNATISYANLVTALRIVIGGGGGGGSASNAVTRVSSNGVPVSVVVTNLNFTNSFGSFRSNAGTVTVDLGSNNIANYANSLFASIGTTRNVLLLGALGGPNDDTTVLQALFNAGGQYYFPPTNYTVSGLWMTNNLQLSGYGATINLKAGTTNRAILAWPGTTIPVTNVVIQGFRFAGGDYSTANSGPTVRSAGSTNRVGISADINSVGSVIEDVYFTGLDKGLTMFSHSDGLQVFEKGNIFLHNCEASSNYFGVYIASTNVNNLVEYFTPIQMRMHDNTYGMYISGGNVGILGCDLTENYCGILLSGTGAFNFAHAFINDNKINHNTLGILCSDIIGQTEQIANNQILANNISIVLSNSAGIRIENNQFGVATDIEVGVNGVSGSSTGPNWLINNSYGGYWGNQLGSGFFAFDWNHIGNIPTDNYTNLIHYGNYSYNKFGDRDPYLVDPFQTNLIGSIQPVAIFTNSSTPGQVLANLGNGITGFTNPPSGTIGPSLTTNLVQWTNQPTFTIGHLLIISGTNAAGSLIVTDYAAPSSTNYVGVTNSPGLATGMILVFTGLTNADGAPVFKGTNYTSGGAAFPLAADGNANQFQITNASAFGLQTNAGGPHLAFSIAPDFTQSLPTVKLSPMLDTTYTGFKANYLYVEGNGFGGSMQAVIVVTNSGVNTTITSNSITTGSGTFNGGPISVIPTNAAPVMTFGDKGGLTLPVGLTNSWSGRGAFTCQYYLVDSTLGTAIITFSNEVSGQKLYRSPGSLAFIDTNFYTLPLCSTNDIWRIRNESTGTGTSAGVLTNTFGL